MVNSPGFIPSSQKGLTRSSNDSGFASFSRAILDWYSFIPVHVNENIIRDLSLSLEGITESVAKTIATQQWSFGSLAEGVLDNRIVLDYLPAEQVSVPRPTSLATSGLTLLFKLKSAIQSWNYSLIKHQSLFSITLKLTDLSNHYCLHSNRHFYNGSFANWQWIWIFLKSKQHLITLMSEMQKKQ